MKNNMELVFKKKWLQWALDFAQMDLGSLSEQKRKALVEEIGFFCFRDFSESSWDEYQHTFDLVTQEEYDALLKDVDPLKIQKKLVEFLKKLDHIHEPRSQDAPTERTYVYELPRMAAYITSSYEGEFQIRRFPEENIPDNWLIPNFVNLIEGFETYPVRKCKGKNKDKECGRYFLNFSTRNKVYCTPSCASRSIQAEKREELKRTGRWKAYLRKMKKYQKERYKERIKAKLGPNVKVGRKEG
jgi:hypothetical protein